MHSRPRLTTWLYLSPLHLLLLAILTAPSFYVLWLSLNESSYGSALTWVGLDNYRAVFDDGYFWRAAWNTFFVVNGVVYVELLFGLVLAALKWLYWRAIDAAPAPATRGAAIGLPDRDVKVFERPHTEANFVTREMVFELARRHAARLRLAALAGLVAVPLLAAALLLVGWIPALAATALAAVGLLAGAFLERWLFFAQARHVVAAYY